MKSLIGLPIIVLSMLLISAGCDKKTEAEEVAERICQCSEPGLAIQKQMDEAKDDPERIRAIMEENQEKLSEMIDCQNKIEEEFGEKFTDENFETEVREAMREVCPEIADQMEGNVE